MSFKDLIRNKKQEIANKTGRREATVKPPVGKSKWRILPSWRNPKDLEVQFWHDFGQHFVKDAAGELKAVHVCLAKTYSQECPICEAISEAIDRSSDDSVIEVLKQAKASQRILVNALALDGEDPSKPVILELTSTTFDKVLDLMEEYGEDGDFLSLDKGFDIVINRTGKGINTEYNVMVAAKSGKVDPSVLKALNDLDAYVKQHNLELQNRAIGTIQKTSGLLTAPERTDKPKPRDITYDDDVPSFATSTADVELDGVLDDLELDLD